MADRRPRASSPLVEAVNKATVAELRRRTARRGARKGIAHEAGLSQSMLCEVLSGRKAPPLRLALTLGVLVPNPSAGSGHD